MIIILRKALFFIEVGVKLGAALFLFRSKNGCSKSHADKTRPKQKIKDRGMCIEVWRSGRLDGVFSRSVRFKVPLSSAGPRAALEAAIAEIAL